MPIKILLADDSVTIQKVVELTFSDKYYEVVTVSDGESAIRKAKEKHPNIILLDVIMPGMDGYEVCSILKQDPELKDVPVLLLTGTFEVFDTDRSARVGANGYITKPFESQELIARVRRLVGQQPAEAASGDEDVDADPVLPEFERDDAPESRTTMRREAEDEDFPEFVFDASASDVDNEVLFDFSMDSGESKAAAPLAVRGESGGGQRSMYEPQKKDYAAQIGSVLDDQTAAELDFDDNVEPTFELPEFELPDGEEPSDLAARPYGGTQSFWDIEDEELSTNLAAITTPHQGRSAPGRTPGGGADTADWSDDEGQTDFGLSDSGREPDEDASQYVFAETQKLPHQRLGLDAEGADRGGAERGAQSVGVERQGLASALAAAVDLRPVLERMEKLEALLQRTGSASAEAGVDSLDEALQRKMPQILDHIAEAVGAKLPEIVDRAADRLSAKIAEQFSGRLQQGGFDTREIITSIAWQVVPDVAEMLVRRELEEIRRRI